MTIPMAIAATRPVSGASASHNPAVVRTVARIASAARTPVSRTFFSKNHKTLSPTAAPTRPTAMRPAKPNRPRATLWAWCVIRIW